MDVGCTAKAGKAGVTNLNFFVGISYNKGVVLCERYYGTVTGEKFASVVKKHFPDALEKSINPKGKRIIQDNCPRQNSKLATAAMWKIGAKLTKIPPRSPDINCIENLFAQVSQELDRQAKDQKIKSETKEEFEARIRKTFMEFPVERIDKLIESMPKRIDEILKNGGKRINY